MRLDLSVQFSSLKCHVTAHVASLFKNFRIFNCLIKGSTNFNWVVPLGKLRISVTTFVYLGISVDKFLDEACPKQWTPISSLAHGGDCGIWRFEVLRFSVARTLFGWVLGGSPTPLWGVMGTVWHGS